MGRANGYDYRQMDVLAGTLACDGFELMMFRSWYENPTAFLRYFTERQFCIPVVHCQKGIGENISIGGDAETREALRQFSDDCAAAKEIGARKLVLHLWGGLASDGNFHRNLDAYPRVCEIAAEFGLELLIENVVCNVSNPAARLYELRSRYPEVKIVFDTKMAAFHTQLEQLYEADSTWMWKEGHICHYHVNDYGGGYMDWGNLRTLPIGRGHIDFDRFFAFVRASGYAGDFTVEATAFDGSGVVDTAMLNEQFRYIRTQIS